jgi:hypothetical protein
VCVEVCYMIMSEYIEIGIRRSSVEKLLYKTVMMTVVDENPVCL